MGSSAPVVVMVTPVASISDPAPLIPKPPEPLPVVPIVVPLSDTRPPLLATTAYAALPAVLMEPPENAAVAPPPRRVR